MTQDYKDTLLKYLTNNITEQVQPDNIPTFSALTYEDSDVYNQLIAVMTNGFVERGILKCKDSKGNYNGKTLIYGYYYIDNTHTFSTSKGFIALLDENYNLLELITQYASGTDCRIFYAMNIDEEGRVYAIDLKPDEQDITKMGRIVLCNNVSIKGEAVEHYKLNLRTSYFLQGNVSTYLTNIKFVFKDVNSASYYIHCVNNYGTELKINVGAANEWNDYNNNAIQNSSFILAGCNALWDSNNTLQVCVISKTTLNNGDVIIDLGLSDSNRIIQHTNLGLVKSLLFSSYSSPDIDLMESSLGSTNKRRLRTTSATIISSTKFYFTSCAYYNDEDDPERQIISRTLKYDNGTITIENDNSSTYSTEKGFSSVLAYTETLFINNSLFIINYINTDNTITYPVFDIYVELIIDTDKNNKQGLGSVRSSNLTEFNLIDITTMYNLYKIYALILDYDIGSYVLENSNLIYNANNYNGTSYEDKNSLEPKQVWLYDENDNIIFARNLYNKTIYNNVTEASVEVPNTMLNDITIGTQKLIGETNYILNVNQDDIEKNIYETLYINFFNTLLIQNRNTQNYITNLIGSSRLNSSVSDINDYDEAKITKFRVNYTNGVSSVKNIISSTITNNIADIQFQITILSDILNIELISNDEQTTYQTITNFVNYDIGKTYIISQKCHVD